MDTDKQPEARTAAPPTMSPVTFLGFIETHRRTLPNRIDRSLMKSNSGSDQPRILSGLQFMGLTEPSGKPTAQFERLRDAEDADTLKAIWRDILPEAYPALTQDFDLANATQQQIEERFREEYKITGETVRKGVAFFLALARNAGITLSPYAKATRTRLSRGGAARRKPTVARDRSRDSVASDSLEIERDLGRLHPAVQAWIDEMPANGETWETADFEDWLTIFKSSIKRAYKISQTKGGDS